VGSSAARRRRERDHPAHPHRRLQRNVDDGLARRFERVGRDRLALAIGEKRKPRLEIGKLAGVAASATKLVVGVRHQHRRLHAGEFVHEALDDRRDLLLSRRAREVARERIQEARLTFAA
jgi:hypothetical protein